MMALAGAYGFGGVYSAVAADDLPRNQVQHRP